MSGRTHRLRWRRSFRKVDAHLRPECWRDWKGPDHGNQGGQTTRWAEENVATWLEKLNPEVALVMFGTNDLRDLDVVEYRQRLRSVVQKCLDHGTVVILSTIPPRHGFVAKSASFANAARQIARELNVPLVDYHAEMLRRRPRDWDGATDAFRAYEAYDVPTLIARDGVHPSSPKQYENDYSVEALRCHGYNLRSYLVLMKYAEVIDALTTTPLAATPSRGSLVKPWYPKPTPLGAPSGGVIKVASVDALFAAVRRVRPNGTILLADGVYPMPRTLVISTNGVTVRSSSGRRGHVILDGRGTLGEMLTIRGCVGVTIADLLIQNVRWNGIKLDSETGVQRVTIHNCVLHNIWHVRDQGRDRAGGGSRAPASTRLPHRVLLLHQRSPQAVRGRSGRHAAVFRRRLYRRNRCDVCVRVDDRGQRLRWHSRPHGECAGAIFLWHDCRDCVVERNVVVDCDSGICLGNSFKPPGIAYHCTSALVRNNFVTRAPENGILADFTRDCTILHNTVHEPKSRFGRLIRVVHDNDGLRVENNLLSGPGPLVETQSRFTVRNNLSRDLSAVFVAASEGNLRLTAAATAAIDRAELLTEVPADIDGTPRDAHPDLGVHEFVSKEKTLPAGAEPPR